MSSIAKRLASQTAVYGISSIVGRVLTYLLVPVYTGRFAAAEYGIVTALYACVSFLNVLFTYGLETTFFRFASRPGTDRQLLYSRVLSLLLVSSIVFSGLLAWQAGTLLRLLKLPSGQERYAVWLALILGLDAVAAIPFARLRLENKAQKFAAIRMANIVLNVALNLFFIIVCPDIMAGEYLTALQPLIARIYDPSIGVGYVFLSNLAASAFTLLLLARELAAFRFSIDVASLRPMLVYAYPIMLMGLAGMVNETLDRILLPAWLPEGFYPGKSSETVAGIYGACYKLSIFMSLVIQAFRYSAEPFFFSQSTEKNSPATFALVLKWFTLCCAFIFVFISVNLEDFAKHFLRSAEYREGIAVVPVLLLANLFLGVYWNLSVWFKLTDKTYYGTYIGGAGAVLTIVLNILLIPVLGYMGCALTTLACYFMMAAICWWLGERHFPVPYPVGRLLAWLLVASGVVALGWFVSFDGYWVRHLWHLVLCASFLGLVVLVEKPHRLVAR